MTLPTGTITMDNIRTEYSLSGALALGSLYAGGSIIAAGSGGINGAIPSSGAISMSHFQGHSAPASTLDTQTVTVQTATIYFSTWNGYHSGHSLGSISDGTCNFKSGASIYGIYKIGFSTLFYFEVNGTQSNADWTTMTVNGNNYTRTSASYGTASGRTYWRWNVGSTNPFGTTSGNKTVTWT